MANGKINFGKQSGGTLGLVFPDGVTHTEVTLPESGTLATLASPAFTGTPTAPTPTAGDSSTKVATTAFATGQDLGVGQTWQDVTASRSAGVTYTNNTGKPIQIGVTIVSGGSNLATITVNSIIFELRYANATDEFSPVFPIIPNGSTYSISGGRMIKSWQELR